jgi:hypothetical protein
MIDIMCTKVLAKEKKAENSCTRRLTDEPFLLPNMYEKLTATLCEKVSKGRIENSLNRPNGTINVYSQCPVRRALWRLVCLSSLS